MLLIYTTLADKTSAQVLVRGLLEKNLIACANILSPGISLYKEGTKVIEACETGVFLKTLPAKKPALLKALKQCHPYDVPCILELESQSLNVAYTKWLQEQL